MKTHKTYILHQNTISIDPPVVRFRWQSGEEVSREFDTREEANEYQEANHFLVERGAEWFTTEKDVDKIP